MADDLAGHLRAFVIEEKIKVDPNFKIYNSAAHALTDAIFSAQAVFKTVENALCRLEKRLPDRSDLTLDALLDDIHITGTEAYSTQVLTRQYLAGRTKIAVLQDAAQFLILHNIHVKSDFERITDESAEKPLLKDMQWEIRGIGPALSRYFLILMGRENYIRPDSLLTRLLSRVGGRQFSASNENDIAVMGQAIRELAQHENTTPARLENALWRYESDHARQGSKSKGSRSP